MVDNGNSTECRWEAEANGGIGIQVVGPESRHWDLGRADSKEDRG